MYFARDYSGDDVPLWIGNLTGEDEQKIIYFGIFSLLGIFAYIIVKRSITQKTISMNGWILEQKKDFLVQGMAK